MIYFIFYFMTILIFTMNAHAYTSKFTFIYIIVFDKKKKKKDLYFLSRYKRSNNFCLKKFRFSQKRMLIFNFYFYDSVYSTEKYA